MNAPLPDVDTLPLDAIDVSEATLYQQDIWRPYFARTARRGPGALERERAVWRLLVSDPL